MIISGGENLYQSEVENLLGAHPKVKDVAVIGRPDATWGETVHAVIVLRNGAVATEREILDWCIDRIAAPPRFTLHANRTGHSVASSPRRRDPIA